MRRRGEHATVGVFNPAVIVDRDEPARAGGDAGDRRTGDAWNGDDKIDIELSVTEHNARGGGDAKRRTGVERHARLGEQRSNGRGATFAEGLEWPALRGDECDLEIKTTAARVGGRQERQLIQRHRPGRPLGEHERDAVDRTALHSADHVTEATPGITVGEQDGMFEARSFPPARGEQHRVVGEHCAAVGADRALIHGNARESVADPARGGVGHDPRERDATDLVVGKRVGDRERAVIEMLLRTEQRDVDATPRESPEP